MVLRFPSQGGNHGRFRGQGLPSWNSDDGVTGLPGRFRGQGLPSWNSDDGVT